MNRVISSYFIVLSSLIFSTAWAKNYGEALQKAIYFYEAQQSGAIPSWNRNEWRGDSALQDGSDNQVDLTGGWYDAGDHVKFGFPMASSATMLAWGVVEYPDAYHDSGQMVHIKNNLRFVADYFVKAHTAPNELWGQVGGGSIDHAWWGPAEVMRMSRPSYKIDSNNPGADLAGETAAALAAISMVFADDDAQYASLLLQHAKELYAFADQHRGKYSDSITDATAFYNSWSGYNDEIVWGAIWLYRATGDNSYLDKAKLEYANLNTEPQQADTKSYKWTQAWDDKSYGCYVLLAKLTNGVEYKMDAERWLDYWTVGYNGNRIRYTPGGLAWLDQWGSNRYAANTAFLAFVYSDYLKTQTQGNAAEKANTYHQFAVNQMNYLLGDNPLNLSYLIGFGNEYPVNPHHRTAHGSWSDNISLPVTSRHLLVGALVGGPGIDDSYEDDRSNFITNEVATDFNAGFTSALARMWLEFGGTPIANNQFPSKEVRGDEFYVEAKINSQGNRHIEISALTHNQSAWPARSSDKLKFHYWIDLTEVFGNGYQLSDISVSSAYNQGATLSSLKKWGGTNDNIYYVEVSFEGVDIAPGGQSVSKKEIQFRFSLPTNSNLPHWDNDNDPSWDNFTSAFKKTNKIALYDNNEIVWGEEPSAPCGPSTNINCEPSANPQSLSTDFESSVEITLSGQDSDGDIVDYIQQSAPANGTLSGSGQTRIYQPDNGFFGADQFTFSVVDDDNAISAPAIVSISVAEPLIPAIQINSPQSGAQIEIGKPINLTVSYQFIDAYNVYFDNSLIAESQTSAAISFLANSQLGSNTIKVIALNSAGEELDIEDSVTVEIIEAPIGGELTCNVENIDVWNTGFVINPVNIENGSDQTVNGWTVKLSFPEPVEFLHGWNAMFSISEGGKVITATPMSYNQTVATNSLVFFGFQGAIIDTFAPPTCSIE